MSQYPVQISDDGADWHEQQLNERRRREDKSAVANWHEQQLNERRRREDKSFPNEIDVFQSGVSKFLDYGAKGRIEAIRWFIDAEANSENGQAAKSLQRYHTLSALNKFMEELHLFTTGDLFSHKNADLFKLSLEIAEACGFSNRDKNQLRIKYQERTSKK